MDEGTGIVHIAPGAGSEDFELSRVHGLPVLTPVDEAGRFYDDYGWLHGLSTVEAAEQDHRPPGGEGASRRVRPLRAPLSRVLALPHAADLSHRRRLVHLGRRDPRADAARQRRGSLDARVLREANGRLAREHGRLEHQPSALLRTAAAVLPVLVRALERDRLARRARGTRRVGLGRPRGAEAAVDRRRADPLRAMQRGRRADQGGRRRLARRRHRALLDARLGRTPSGLRRVRDGRCQRLTTADLPDHAYWEEWFPADWVSEMREQIRLWFYSQLFMSVALVGKAPFRSVLGYEKMLDETGREMHSSWGTRSTPRMRSRAWAPT